jgi:hypothetical protein
LNKNEIVGLINREAESKAALIKMFRLKVDEEVQRGNG